MWILDGYNLLFRMPGLKGSLEQRRELLLQSLSEAFPRRDITVVFDGRLPPPDTTRQHRGRLEIIYTTSDLTADEWIIGRLADLPHPQRTTVVTDDRGLERLAASSGAKTERLQRWIRDIQQVETPLPVVRLARSSHEYLVLFEERWHRMEQGRGLPESGADESDLNR
jgi:predicted RNA-binding protein with PIN domain